MEKNDTSIAQDKNPKVSLKTKAQRTKVKMLSTYYGNPIRDMKLICITGTTGKSTVAHYVHEILKAAGQHVAILASDAPIKASLLHKFFSNAWKAGSTYVIVTAPMESLKENVFYGLPVHIAALTDFVPASLDSPKLEEYLADQFTLFTMKPEVVILNEDDKYYRDFAQFAGTQTTMTYGSTRTSNVHIDKAKLYKKGTEAEMSMGSTRFTAATFLTGEPVVSYMACAVAIADALHVAITTALEGLANYIPQE